MPTPITPRERNKIIGAIRSGCPRNEIARKFKRSSSTISRIAQQEGLSFDRSMTKEATAARKADLAFDRAGRIAATEKALAHQMQLLEKADTPHKMQAWWIGYGIGIDKRRADEETENETAGLDKVFDYFDRVGDEYETLQPEAGLEHIEGDGQA